MYQTMLALLALSLVAVFSLNQQRNALHLQNNMIRSELSVQATGVAVDRLEEIGATDFDEATRNDQTVASALLLTAGPPYPADSPGNDIDDFHGIAVDTFRVNSTNDTLWFRVETSVSYASESDPDQAVVGPSKVKKASVKVYSLDFDTPDTVRFAQSYACGTRCDW